MSDKTVEEIMGLVKAYGYAEARYEVNESPYPSDTDKVFQALAAVQTAVTELEKARDQAQEMLKREVIIRDGWLRDAIKERDALKAQLKESQEFVKSLRDDVRRLNSEDVRF